MNRRTAIGVAICTVMAASAALAIGANVGLFDVGSGPAAPLALPLGQGGLSGHPASGETEPRPQPPEARNVGVRTVVRTVYLPVPTPDLPGGASVPPPPDTAVHPPGADPAPPPAQASPGSSPQPSSTTTTTTTTNTATTATTTTTTTTTTVGTRVEWDDDGIEEHSDWADRVEPDTPDDDEPPSPPPSP